MILHRCRARMMTCVCLWSSLTLYQKDVPLLLHDVGALFIQLVLSMPLSMSKRKYHILHKVHTCEDWCSNNM